MNKTRIDWTTLKCCKDREPSLTEFVTLSSFSIVVGIFFYIGTYLIGSRKERIQHIPDDLMPEDPEQSHESNGTVMNINGDEPTASESSRGSEPEIAKIINNDSDDSMLSEDEDILPIQNSNLIEI